MSKPDFESTLGEGGLEKRPPTREEIQQAIFSHMVVDQTVLVRQGEEISYLVNDDEIEEKSQVYYANTGGVVGYFKIGWRDIKPDRT